MPEINVPILTIETIHRPAKNGRRKPYLCSCEGDEEFEYFVKFHDYLGTGSAKELLAALVGRRLGLPIPPPVIVKTDPELLDMMGIEHEGNSGLSIASLAMMPGYSSMPGYKLPPAMLPMSFMIFAWDMLIANSDRQSENPNMLSNGREFVIFDHEGAFGKELFVGASPPTWNFRNRRMAKGHALFEFVDKNADGSSFDEFLERLTLLDDEFLEDIKKSVPIQWNSSEIVDNICDHFRMVRDNNKELKLELLGTFV